jgi:iron complex outermembrane recepter protein
VRTTKNAPALVSALALILTAGFANEARTAPTSATAPKGSDTNRGNASGSERSVRIAQGEVRIEFNIPKQSLADALAAWSKQSGLQILRRDTDGADLTASSVNGKLSPAEALTKLLAATGLTFEFVNDRTVRVAPARSAASTISYSRGDQENKSMTVAQNTAPENSGEARNKGEQSEQKKVGAANESEALKTSDAPLTEVQVTGSRIRTLLGEQNFTPMVTFTRADIERAGMTSIGEISRLIPQAYSQGAYDGIGFGGQNGGLFNNVDGHTGQAANVSRSTFNLRGLGAQNTLVLVNGRRIAKSGTISGNEANDLAGIPISSIERIEVLTDGASAIYGSDAVGGVINVIQRKNYDGTEVSASYENTFDTNTAVSTIGAAHSFVVGKLSASLSGSYQHRNAFAATDRYFTATTDWTKLGGTLALEPVYYGGIALGAGIVESASGDNLPGHTSPFALIPTGATGAPRPASDYVSITSADLASYTGDPAKYLNLISPQTNRGASLRLNYSLGERTSLFLDSRYSDTLTEIEGLPVNYRNSIFIPGDDPRNPFGEDVYLYKTFWELPRLQGQKDAKTSNAAVATGVQGMLGADWRYEAGVDWSRSVLRDTNAWDPLLREPNAAGEFASDALVLLYDSRAAAPNDENLLLSFLAPGNRLDRNVSMGLFATADGPLFNLPAGALRMAIGAEHRRDSAETAQSLPDPPRQSFNLLGDFDRDIDSAYAEVLAPMISAAQNIPLVYRLDLTAALRYDRYSDAGSEYSPRYGLTYRPVSWLMLRGTRNYAFRAPTLNSLYRPTTIGNLRFSFLPPEDQPIDHARNDEVVNFNITSLIGGNLALQPETSVSKNIGIVLELPFKMFDGLSLSADLADFDYTNRIFEGLDAQYIMDFLPERVTRGAGLPGDPPGLPGRITRLDVRGFNIGQVKIRSVDYQIRYTRTTAIGTFDLRAAATSYDTYDSKNTPLSATASTSYDYPDRYTWQSYWNRGPLGLALSGFYQPRQFTDATRTVQRWGSALEWNGQFAYDFHAAGFSAGSGSSLVRLLADTKVALTINNLFDREPPHLQGSAGFAVSDPRMRRYSLSLVKTF